MRKRDELADPTSCLNKAGLRQMLFVMHDGDPAMAGTIRHWIGERLRLGLNDRGQVKLHSAEAIAMYCEALRGRQFRSPREMPPEARGLLLGTSPVSCRGCGYLLLTCHSAMDDGCPCNSPRKINDGLRCPDCGEARWDASCRCRAEAYADVCREAGQGRRGTLVRQQDARDCGVAALQMLTGHPRETIVEYFNSKMSKPLDFSVLGLYPHGVDDYLVDAGFALARKNHFRGFFRRGHEGGSIERKPWPPEPWSDMHLCEVVVAESSPVTHFVVMLGDGSVLDPMADAPRRGLTDYYCVQSVAAVVPGR